MTETNKDSLGRPLFLACWSLIFISLYYLVTFPFLSEKVFGIYVLVVFLYGFSIYGINQSFMLISRCPELYSKQSEIEKIIKRNRSWFILTSILTVLFLATIYLGDFSAEKNRETALFIIIITLFMNLIVILDWSSYFDCVRKKEVKSKHENE